MIICDNDGESVYTSWRENGERMEEIIPFKPYFYIKEDAHRHDTYTHYGNVFEFEYGEDTLGKNLEGEDLVKVFYQNSKHLRSIKDQKLFPLTYEADVTYHHRYCVDALSELKEYDMRKWYWDMEWQFYEDAEIITTIVAYDNYDKQYYQWAWFPNYEGENELFFDSEKAMLESFKDILIEKNPDMLIAWFGLKFDLPKLIQRMIANELNPNELSPIGKVRGVTSSGEWQKDRKKNPKDLYKEGGYTPISQPISGRITLNLDLAFERQWNDSQRGTLPSLSLDYVSELVLGHKKLVTQKFDNMDEFYKRGWLEETELYLEYAVVDVQLLVELDEKNFTSEAIVALQRLLVAPFDACFYASHMGGIYFMRNAYWKAPTGNKNVEREDYEGAMIYNPLDEGTNGLHLGVAAFDYAGLYPSMMIARNISWETKSTEPTEFGVDINIPRNLQPLSDNHMSKMLYYKTDKLGLLPRAVLELKELRNDYKAKMKYARENNTGDYQKWYNNQMAVKRLMASFYGIVAYQGFGWADVDLAASITASAREAIREAAFVARSIDE